MSDRQPSEVAFVRLPVTSSDIDEPLDDAAKTGK